MDSIPSNVAPSPYADLFSFLWSKATLRLPAICAAAVGLCLVVGVTVGHPSAGLIAGGGAFTVGFGINQRIRDSRLLPMLAAAASMSASTFVGMVAGHVGVALLAAAALWAFAYGILTARAPGVSWVGQQAAVSLFVASAFPASPRAALYRSGMILLGATVQIVAVSLPLRLWPELRQDLLAVPRGGWDLLREGGSMIRTEWTTARAHGSLPGALHRMSHAAALSYALRLALTAMLSAELYRRVGIASGYWIPMTALLVQKPHFAETLTRTLLRVGGTLGGAVLASLLLQHLRPDPLTICLLSAAFAFGSYVTNQVNYGVFSFFLTTYIVVLLSLNALPGPLLAHRRAACTILGGLIALVLHVFDLGRRHQAHEAHANA